MNHAKALKRAILFAALFMFLPLPVMQYVGEESFYTLGAYEMFVRDIWWHQSLFSSDMPKTPLFAWMIIAVSNSIGWGHLDIAPRIVSVLSSWGAAFIAFKMAGRLFPQHTRAGWIAALIYLTMGEVSFWYGWLGYADATFSFFIFAAIACLWVAIEDERASFALLSSIMISLAFMVKNISCYAILGIAALVFMQRYQRWILFRRPLFVLIGLITLSIPWLYQHYAIHSDANANMAIGHALDNFNGFGFLAYLKHWVVFPTLFFARAFPVTVLLLWFYWRQRQRYKMDAKIMTLVWLLITTMAPFWLSAGATPRYMVPFYGLFALLLTGLVLQLDTKKSVVVFRAMILIIALKIPYSFAALPWLKDWRPNHSLKAVASDVLQRTRGKPVRTKNGIASGLSIAAYMDVQLPPERYIREYRGKEHGVFIMAAQPDVNLGRLVKAYPIRGRHLYLYWKP